MTAHAWVTNSDQAIELSVTVSTAVINCVVEDDIENQANHKYASGCIIRYVTVRFNVFTAVSMNTSVFWGVPQCGACKNRRLRVTYRLHHQCDKNRIAKNNVTRTTQRNILEDGILQVCDCLQDMACRTQFLQNKKQTPWPLVRERTIPTERPPLVDEI
jgi:hypothetical protein